MPDQNINDFFGQPSQTRYNQTVDALKATQSVFALADTDGCLIIPISGENILPIWLTKEQAEHWLTEEYEGFSALEIEAQAWLGKWLPGMANDQYKVGVCPNLAGECITVSAAELLSELA
ncbi:DUF2750 domain-containing protein [Marinomonas mediterranea]|uniref:DUF2750 domain-containing protein n=1 Tax=Marinomonas mediterranea TaxID=119864 RepID=UPI00234B2D63|nr:DUF2750 domain-containing protein [Marinomonas mediterranea]WCN09041.1 DUF2750 domain-containing protein [Marinomonas mediterranea]